MTYQLWVEDNGYIEGKQVGRASKNIDTLKKRAAKHFGEEKLHYVDRLETEDKCIWIDIGEHKVPAGLIRPKGP